MIAIGNFFFKYRNLLFPIFALSIFIPSPSLFRIEDYWIPLITGLLIAIGGQAIRALTIALKYIVRGGVDKKVYADNLVIEGMFHHCRNPLYVGNVCMLIGVGLLSNSLYFVLFAIPVFCFIYQCIVLAEEHYLRNKFGAQYERYTQHVNRWLPDLRGLSATFSSMTFNWKRYIINEYNTIYLLVLSIGIVLFTHHPDLIRLQSQQKMIIFFTAFFSLSFIYLFVRYLKKSGKLVYHG